MNVHEKSTNELTADKRKYGILPTNRIEALTDGVFAIAMTLLALSIRLPDSISPVSESPVKDLITGQLDLFFNYVLSFTLLAIFWIQHHRQFQNYRQTDHVHLWINIFILMFVALVPFSTTLVGYYTQYRVADVFFAGNIFFIGLLNYLSFWYANSRGYLRPDLPPHVVVLITRRSILTPGISLLAVLLALIYPPVSSFIFLLIPIFLYHPRFRF